jgi:arylsulfatase A-like enzyme
MKKPNVLIIISDQLSTRIVDGSGNNKHNVLTPGIDSIARDGVRFTESYSAFPLCCPARASIFTGMMPHNHNITDNEEFFRDELGYIPSDESLKTMGELFQEDGYETCYFGKEHAGGYGWKGIENFGSMKYSAGGMLAEGSAYDQIFTKDAIEFINQEHEKPFYMTLSLINPHDICKVLGGKVQGATFMDAIFFCRDESEPYLRYNDRASLPSNYNLPYIKGMINDEDYMYKELEDRNENEWRRYISTYNLLIEKTDWYIELVLDALKKNGLEEDTIVVFTTDHGDLMGSHKLIAKTAFYEESAKTFMLLRYPKKIKHAINNEAKISTIDLMPTLLELCNIKAPNDVDGKSFKEALYNKNENFSIVVSENPFGKMVRYQSLKYIKSIVNDEEYEILIDLEKDPEESTNCIEDSVYQSDVVFLRTYLDNYLKEKGITLNYK